VKVNLHYTVLFALLFILPSIALAQENEHRIPRDYNAPAVTPPSEEVVNELNNLVEEESTPLRPASANYLAKDSMVTKSYATPPVHRGKNNVDHQRSPADSSKNSDKEREGSDSILSFNFIYYIFQKFKLSDIVDEDK
jgi:hypothetical protein